MSICGSIQVRKVDENGNLLSTRSFSNPTMARKFINEVTKSNVVRIYKNDRCEVVYEVLPHDGEDMVAYIMEDL